MAALDVKFPLTLRATSMSTHALHDTRTVRSGSVLCHDVAALREAWHSAFNAIELNTTADSATSGASPAPVATIAHHLSVEESDDERASGMSDAYKRGERGTRRQLADGVYEVLLRSHVHPRVGPILAVGSSDGVLEDLALALPPLSVPLARQAMERTKIFGAIQRRLGTAARASAPSANGSTPAKPSGAQSVASGSGRLRSFDGALESLESTVACFSRLITEQPIVRATLRVVVDTRRGPAQSAVVATRAVLLLEPANKPTDATQMSVIRGYPSEFVTMWAGDSMGTPPVTFRVVRPEDEPLVRRFYRRVTAEKDDVPTGSALASARGGGGGGGGGAAEGAECVRKAEEARPVDWVKDRVVNLCHSDYATKLTLIAEARNRESGMLEILGLGQLLLQNLERGTAAVAAAAATPEDTNEAINNFSVVVLSQDRSPGLRIELLRRIVQMARSEQLPYISSVVHTSNEMLIRTCKMLGFTLDTLENERVRVSLKLQRSKKTRPDAH